MFEVGISGYSEGYERLSELAVDSCSPQLLDDHYRLPEYLIPNELFPEVQAPVILSADSIPELQKSRNEARQEGWRTIAANQALLDRGLDERVPLVVDPLGTARLVVQAEAEFGDDSPEYLCSLEALRLDTRRLVGEAKRKLTWEAFPAAVQLYDERSADFLADGGISLNDLTYNGLSPNPVAEKEQIRVEDWVEEKGTYQAIGRLIFDSKVSLDLVDEDSPLTTAESLERMNTIRFSLCPDWAIEKYELNPTSSDAYEGFVPSNQKFMIRNLAFGSAIGGRQESQLAVSGKYIRPSTIARAINYLDQAVPADASKQTINSTIMVTSDQVDEWDWIEFLDALASEEQGVEVFMGELFDGEAKDYQAARQQAAIRYAELDEYTDVLTDGIILLAKAGINPVAASEIIETKLKDMMLEECRVMPEKAKEMFNEQTAIGFQRAIDLEEMGRLVDAMNVRKITVDEAPDVSFCGAGSCGLENVSKEEIANNKQIEDSIEPGDIVLRDTVNGCPECGKKKLVYVFNEKKVVKICEACTAYEKTKGSRYGSNGEQ